MDNRPNSVVVSLRAHLAGIEIVGDLEQRNTSKRRDHFVIVSVDETEVAKSEKKLLTAPASRWEWPEGHQFRFSPSSTVKIMIYRKTGLRITKNLVGQYSGKVIELLENNSSINLKDRTGAGMGPKLKIDLSLISEPEDQDSFENFMKTVDADISRLDSTIRAPPGILALARALQLTKSILDIVVNIDPSPILKTSLVVMSAVYEAINQTSLQDDSVRELTESLREMLGIANEYRDLPLIKGTTDVIEEIGRISLKVASLIHEYTSASFGRRTLKSQLSDDIKMRIAQYRSSCENLKQKINIRIDLDTNRAIKRTKVTIDDNDAKIQNTLQTIKDDQLAKDIQKWLSAPDSSKNYNEAHEKHQMGTCSWFLDGPRFREFQESADFLWIKGTAGCGKTVLCSSIIEMIIKLRKQNASVTYAYFFFDGRDGQKELQQHDKFIRSLILQLSLQCNGIPAILVELYGHGHQQPSTDSLEATLYRIINEMHMTYIIVDSLDECIERDKTLRWINQIVSHRMNTLHIAVASRPERDINDILQPLDQSCVDLANTSGNNDISVYLDEQVSPVMKWDEETRNIIKSTLAERADGMFRWVALQLMELKKCSSRRSVMTQLERLPNGLYETYDRILSKIDNQTDRTDAKTFLRWLCFSVRPMELSEIAETVTVDFDAENEPRHTPVHRYWDKRDVFEKCAGLITESEGFITRRGLRRTFKPIKLAHFSIKEYLLSEHLCMGASSSFHLASEELSHSLISQACLAYLLQFNAPDSVNENIAISSPLAEYAAENWVFHAQSGGIESSEPSFTLTLAQKLFIPNSATLTNWVRLRDYDDPYSSFYSEWKPNLKRTIYVSALYYASFMGLQQLSLYLLKEVDINAQGGKYGTALQAASYGGHQATMQLLLEKGADVNTQGGYYGNALQAASFKGHEAIVQLLLEKGADVNAQGGHYGNVLQAASYRGHEAIVQLLLEKGADVNAQGGCRSNALQAASSGGHLAIVQLLLKKGADVNTQGGLYDNALQAASYEGHEAVVQLLLEKGADLNTQGGLCDNALQAASYEGHEAVVQLLLEKGADLNAQGGLYNNALQAASYGGHEAIVQLLLEKGADVNTRGGRSLSQFLSEEREISVMACTLTAMVDEFRVSYVTVLY